MMVRCLHCIPRLWAGQFSNLLLLPLLAYNVEAFPLFRGPSNQGHFY